MDFKLLLASMLAVVLSDVTATSAAVAGNSGWNSSPSTQYHIQTDEGDERYFRYQTTSGQYRKEKRLEDGTVIGTSGWVDPNGMLRLSDYIADNKGYRILRSKMIFVGTGDQIGKGVSKAKFVPASAGELVSQTVNVDLARSTARPPLFSNSPSAAASVSPIAPPSFSQAGSDATFDTSYRYPTPNDVNVNDVNVQNAIGVLYPDQVDALPALNAFRQPYEQPAAAAPVTAIPYQYRAPPVGNYRDFGQKTTRYVPNNYDHPSGSRSKYESFGNSLGYREQEGFGISNNRQQQQQQQLPTYDGISTTKDGFRYYLPRQYHEEVSSPSGQTRTGSFGYIDPFGIRRVTYYNTNPGSGFIHRKNNRYVGFNATPYDPRF